MSLFLASVLLPLRPSASVLFCLCLSAACSFRWQSDFALCLRAIIFHLRENTFAQLPIDHSVSCLSIISSLHQSATLYVLVEVLVDEMVDELVDVELLV